MRVLVTGAGGLLAAAIVKEFRQHHEVCAFIHCELDISAPAASECILSVDPDVVINCAGYNDVDAAEDDPIRALTVNALALRNLVEGVRAANAALVHYSTDFVFDGVTDHPYTEVDRPNPRGTYAASKLLGEWFALEYRQAYVLRVESLFGEPTGMGTRHGSLDRIVSRIRAGTPVPVFTDRIVSPTYTTDAARATRELLAGGHPPGLYHCVNSGAATWAEVAAEAARLLGVPWEMTTLTLDTASLRALRPRYCALSNAKLRAQGIAMPPWQDGLRRHLLGDGD